MPIKKAKVLDIVNTVHIFAVECPYCQHEVNAGVAVDFDFDDVECEKCRLIFRVNAKEYADQIRKKLAYDTL